MVDVGVGYKNGVQFSRGEREVFVLSLLFILSLLQAAIDQELSSVYLQIMTASGHFFIRTKEF